MQSPYPTSPRRRLGAVRHVVQWLWVPILLGIVTACTAAASVPQAREGTPTAIAEVIAKADVRISCPDGAAQCDQPQCDVTNPSPNVVTGVVQSAPGLFASSYASNGFSLGDGTGGVFVLSDEDLALKRGDRVQVSGITTCQFGTLSLGDTTVQKLSPQTPIVFAPRQIGQLSKPPQIYGDPQVTPNWCDCLMPFSATEGDVITVRGTAVADLEDDGVFGYKLFLDDGNGVAQIFIDADSDVSVDKIRHRLLVQGTDLCVSGVVGQFAGVGFELLPRNDQDIQRARPNAKDPCG